MSILAIVFLIGWLAGIATANEMQFRRRRSGADPGASAPPEAR